MGIFASRNVQKDEELTFNYNVDRYGCVTMSFGNESPV
jgi:histone-lysine N-methyltransferase SETD2